MLPDRRAGYRAFRHERAEAARGEGHLHLDHFQGVLLSTRAAETGTPELDAFIAGCRATAGRCPDPADCVQEIAPLMADLIGRAKTFLKPSHYRSDPAHYARNAIHIAADRTLSLYTLVWLPGQWTPVHDHGSWGVVGVVEGVLEERAYMSTDGEICRNDGIRLKRGGLVLLPPGAVTTFVPNPDHIHRTGVAPERARVVSLHLYGRMMNSFHEYDVARGTRRLIDVAHQDS